MRLRQVVSDQTHAVDLWVMGEEEFEETKDVSAALRIRLTNTAWCYMRTPEQVKWDFVQQWLNRARKDLAACD